MKFGPLAPRARFFKVIFFVQNILANFGKSLASAVQHHMHAQQLFGIKISFCRNLFLLFLFFFKVIRPCANLSHRRTQLTTASQTPLCLNRFISLYLYMLPLRLLCIYLPYQNNLFRSLLDQEMGLPMLSSLC